MSQIDFGWIFDGFTMNLRFGIGQKSSGIVEPCFLTRPEGGWDGFNLKMYFFLEDVRFRHLKFIRIELFMTHRF